VIIALQKGNMILACVSIIALVGTWICLIIFIPKFGGKNRGLIDLRIDQWTYSKDGTVSMPEPESTKKQKRLDGVVGVVVGRCILGRIYSGMEGYIAFKYMLPVSALYYLPFLVFEYCLQRPRLGPLVPMCPILCTIHAILIVAGVPIFFTENLCVLNLFLSVFGYGFLAYVICHVYSRYALKKLKTAAHLQENTNEQ